MSELYCIQFLLENSVPFPFKIALESKRGLLEILIDSQNFGRGVENTVLPKESFVILRTMVISVLLDTFCCLMISFLVLNHCKWFSRCPRQLICWAGKLINLPTAGIPIFIVLSVAMHQFNSYRKRLYYTVHISQRRWGYFLYVCVLGFFSNFFLVVHSPTLQKKPFYCHCQISKPNTTLFALQRKIEAFQPANTKPFMQQFRFTFLKIGHEENSVSCYCPKNLLSFCLYSAIAEYKFQILEVIFGPLFVMKKQTGMFTFIHCVALWYCASLEKDRYIVINVSFF